jgi:hypothetical protein
VFYQHNEQQKGSKIMNKQQYLRSEHINDFLDFIAKRLDGNGFPPHSYHIRRSNKLWSCDSLWVAHQKYDWSFSYRDHQARHRGNTYAQNTQALNSLRLALRSGLTSCDADAALADASRMVFEWGGVTKGNVKWAADLASSGGLVKEYQQGLALLNPETADDRLVGFNLRFNAGLTKVYSLMLDDFIIYDSRVGAALGWLVVQYCQQALLSAVPDALAFPWAAAKEGVNAVNPKNRNPSAGIYRLPQFKTGLNHAQWNLRASWMLAALIEKNAKLNRTDNPMRELESALFMIGYDLPISSPIAAALSCAQSNKPRGKQSHLSVEPVTEIFPLKTRSKGLLFRVETFDDRIGFHYKVRPNNTRRPSDEFQFDELYKVLRDLFERFGLNAFPLGNNVEKLGKNTEKEGLGMAIKRACNNDITKAQAASYLGPYLEEISVFEFEQITSNTAWKLSCAPNDDEIIAAIRDYAQSE